MHLCPCLSKNWQLELEVCSDPGSILAHDRILTLFPDFGPVLDPPSVFMLREVVFEPLESMPAEAGTSDLQLYPGSHRMQGPVGQLIPRGPLSKPSSPVCSVSSSAC